MRLDMNQLVGRLLVAATCYKTTICRQLVTVQLIARLLVIRKLVEMRLVIRQLVAGN